MQLTAREPTAGAAWILISLCVVAAVLASFRTSSHIASRISSQAVHNGSPFRESYLSDEAVRKLKSDKSSAYNEAGIRYFYSDGNAYPTNAVYFRPSDEDIVCTLSKQDVKNVAKCPANLDIEYVTVMDTRTQFTDPRFECSSMMAPIIRRDLRNNMDARVRLLMGEYEFTKTCLTMEVLVSQPSPRNTLIVDSMSFSTKLFFLLRPIFIRGPQCAPNRPRTVSMYDSHGTLGRIPIVVDGIQDPRISRDNGQYTTIDTVVETSRVNAAAYRTEFVNIPMVVYYMNFVRDVPVEIRHSNVVTAFITSSTANAEVQVSENASILVATDKVVVDSSLSSQPFEVVRSKENSVVVVTFTTSLLIMASMDQMTGRVQVVQVGGMPVVNASMDVVKRFNQLFPPDNNIYPYTNTSIPNLADIALKLNIIRP